MSFSYALSCLVENKMNLKPRMPRQLLVSSLEPEGNHLNVRHVCNQGREAREKHVAEAVLNNKEIFNRAIVFFLSDDLQC